MAWSGEDWQREVDRLERRIAQLELALKPFAREAGLMHEEFGITQIILEPGPDGENRGPVLKVNDFRRAARALGKAKR